MDRKDVILRVALNSMADDYENVDQVILRHVARDTAEYGWTIQRAEIVEALTALVGDGLAKAYILSAVEPVVELEAMPPLDVVEEYFKTYFYITKKGIELLHDANWWGLDNEDSE
jgi:hypothetical protein